MDGAEEEEQFSQKKKKHSNFGTERTGMLTPVSNISPGAVNKKGVAYLYVHALVLFLTRFIDRVFYTIYSFYILYYLPISLIEATSASL